MPRAELRITHSLVVVTMAFVLCMAGRTVIGADVAVEVSPHEIYFGESFTLAIQITNARTPSQPTLPSMPPTSFR